jgi:serine/threonine protein kinase
MDEPTSLDPTSISPTPSSTSPDELASKGFVPESTSVERTVVAHSPIASPNEFYANGTVASLAQVLIGQSLDHYLLHDLVGGGGMGAVFRATDTRLDREVAVKVIPNLGRDLEAMRRFQVEAQSAAKLDHPHIARVYYVGETEAWSYIVFEYVEGINLRDLVIREGPLSVDDAVCYTVQVANALQHASERSVVHRDIKPSNVLVTSDGLVKVVDMGLARTTSFDRPNQDLTLSGVTLGTFDYISPEQASDPRAADVRSDLYSLGCSLYFFLTGRPPFADGNAFQKLIMHGTVEPTDPSIYRSDLPADLIAIIRKLMAKRPEDRYQTPADLEIDLGLLADFEHLSRTQTLSHQIAPTVLSQRSRSDVVLPWLVGILLVMASTAYLYFQHRLATSFEIPKVEEASEEWLEQQAKRRLSQAATSRNDEPGTETIIRTFNPDTTSPMELAEVPSQSVLGLNPTQSPKLDAPDEPSTASILWLRPFGEAATRLTPDDGDDYRIVTGSLAEAIVQADSDPQIESIWLDDDVWRLDRPIALKRSSLILKSAPNRIARVEFRIQRDIFASQSTNSLNENLHGIAVGSNHLIFEDLELVVYPPTTSRGRLNLLEVAAGGTVHALHSTITMMPSGGDWQVSVFGSPNEAPNPLDSTKAPFHASNKEPLQITLEDSVIRGEGSFLNLQSARRAEINWNNGLLCVSGRMIETSGATEASRTPPTIRLDLRDVTVAAELGFARIRLHPNADLPVCLTRTANNCAFWSKPTSPVIAMENFDDSTEAENGEGKLDWLSGWLDLRGADNAYDSEIGALVRIVDKRDHIENIDFESRSSSIFEERAPETMVRWISRLPSPTPFEQQTAGDYLQKDGAYRPGFRADQLPNH